MRLLFFTKNRINSYGIPIGLLVSANFLQQALLDNFKFVKESHLQIVTDGNDLDRYIKHFRADTVIIEALWITPSKIDELTKKYKGVKFIIRIHSKVPFLSNEGNSIGWIKDYIALKRDNLVISFNNLSCTEQISEALDYDFEYLPNIYWPKITSAIQRVNRYKRIVDISCFGAIRPLKNQLQQALASIIFAKDIEKRLRFHINVNRTEQNGESALKNIRALFTNSSNELIEHEWTDHESFLRIIGRMHLGTQISLSESFNLVSADHVVLGVPIVVSPDIDWLSEASQADPNNAFDIVNKMHNAWNDKDLVTENQCLLGQYNKEALKVWNRFLNDK